MSIQNILEKNIGLIYKFNDFGPAEIRGIKGIPEAAKEIKKLFWAKKDKETALRILKEIVGLCQVGKVLTVDGHFKIVWAVTELMEILSELKCSDEEAINDNR